MQTLNAIRVVGSTIEVDESTFMEVLGLKGEGVVTTAKKGTFSTSYVYQVNYLDFTFYHENKRSLLLPSEFKIIVADKIISPITAVL